MSRALLSGVAILPFLWGCWLFGDRNRAGAEPESVGKVSAADLNSGTVVVIGSLGTPLNTLQTVRGTWQYPAGDGLTKGGGELWFHVTHVNGETLAKPVEFHHGDVHIKYPLPWDKDDKRKNGPAESVGETWEIRAYETGAFQRSPIEYEKELREGRKWIVQRDANFRDFRLELHGIMRRPTAPEKKPATPAKRNAQ